MSAKTLSRSAAETSVKRLLRRRSSPEYFKEGGWTNDPTQADSFSDIVQAAEICARHGLRDVELALRFDSDACDLFCTPIR